MLEGLLNTSTSFFFFLLFFVFVFVLFFSSSVLGEKASKVTEYVTFGEFGALGRNRRTGPRDVLFTC